jgi:hypothetical protein
MSDPRRLIDGQAALSIPDAARWAGLSVDTILALIESGRLDLIIFVSARAGQPRVILLIPAAALLDWLER